MTTQLVLASGSPRRSDLLRSLGLQFTVRPVDLDESPHDGELPEAYVRRLAEEKATAIIHDGEWTLAADTIVVLDGKLLGKPTDPDDAVRMLGTLSGRQHRVLTGIALCRGTRQQISSHVESTLVEIAPLNEEFRRWYVNTGEPLDKAGSYGAQGLGAVFVNRIEGSYSNVVGLPMHALFTLFASAKANLMQFRS